MAAQVLVGWEDDETRELQQDTRRELKLRSAKGPRRTLKRQGASDRLVDSHGRPRSREKRKGRRNRSPLGR